MKRIASIIACTLMFMASAEALAQGYKQPSHRGDSRQPYYGNQIVEQRGRLGLIDNQQRWILEPVFDRIEFVGGNIKAMRGYKWGLFSISGREIIPVICDNISTLGSFLKITRGRRIGICSMSGREIIPPVCDNISLIKNYDRTYFQVAIRGSMGIFSNTGREIIPAVFDRVDLFHDSFRVARNGRYGLYSTDGRQVYEPIYGAIIYDQGRFYVRRIEPERAPSPSRPSRQGSNRPSHR